MAKSHVPFQPSTEIKGKIKGVTFDNADGSSRQQLIRKHARAGRRLRLRFENDDPHMDHAAAALVEVPGGIFKKDQHYQIGYLPNSTAYNAKRCQEQGKPVYLEILNVTGGTRDKPTSGVNFIMYIGE